MTVYYGCSKALAIGSGRATGPDREKQEQDSTTKPEVLDKPLG